jgi:hypothetical protein
MRALGHRIVDADAAPRGAHPDQGGDADFRGREPDDGRRLAAPSACVNGVGKFAARLRASHPPRWLIVWPVMREDVRLDPAEARFSGELVVERRIERFLE